MSLDGSGQLWTAALRKQFQFVLAGYGRFWAGSAGLWAALARSGRLWEALRSVLDGSGRVWEALEGSGWALAGLWTALDGVLEASLERIWKALDGFDGFGSGLDSSARLWTALDGLESFGWQPGACSQLAECRKSCSYQWWEAYFVKSMFYIAEACSFANMMDF